MAKEASVSAMFTSFTEKWLSQVQSDQRNYGVAVSDVDHDGEFEMIVAGFDGPNLVLKYDPSTESLKNIALPGTPFENLMDVQGAAIGVCACDIDGDGHEEIYFLNTNQAYAGRSAYGDKLFKFRDGRYVDLFFDESNSEVSAKSFAGRSVACIDRLGTGKYAIAVATYSMGGTGKFALLEMDETHPQNNISKGKVVVRNKASQAGIERATGGRGIAVGPLLHDDGKLDLFFDNEGNYRMGNDGANYLFENQGDGTFIDRASEARVADLGENGRGITIADFNRDGLLDICYGNWNGPHRLFIQYKDSDGKRLFKNVATPELEDPTLIRTVIAADFDNDGNLEIFFNNINSYQRSQPNKVFRVTAQSLGEDPEIKQLNIGDALEEYGHGTGGAVADLDGDGFLELLLSHGESREQPLTLYKVNRDPKDNNWIRILPKTKYGAPARGATVYLTTKGGGMQMAVIDSGSGYLCQMEPVAHFGLNSNIPDTMSVRWPDGSEVSKMLNVSDLSQTHVIMHPDSRSTRATEL